MNFNSIKEKLNLKLKKRKNVSYLISRNIIHYDNGLSPLFHKIADKLDKWKIYNNLNYKLRVRQSREELMKRNILSNRNYYNSSKFKLEQLFK
tara:strand:- start:24 stop:302 length:279 start_codon:yes stop_codon:yes gene_type:complete